MKFQFNRLVFIFSMLCSSMGIAYGTILSTENFVDPDGINDQLSTSSTGWEGSGAWYNGEIYVGPHVSTDDSTPDGDGYYVRNITGQSSSKYAITKVGQNTIMSAERDSIEFTCDWASNNDLGARFVAIVDGKRLNGVANVGARPTVNGQRTQLEVHLFGFSDDIYGQTIVVSPVEKLREEIKFASFDALKAQIHKDAQYARQILQN
mgnify:CR=1 FL=1